ncbi:MAG: PaaI family thioesterase [Spirochaetales bacterium]|nr:PaaI family thioesterase [Spirochaetales bacterium]
MFNAPEYLKKLSAGEDPGNPVLNFLGMKLEEFREGYVRFSMEIRPEFKQGMGLMQGGLTVAFADEAAAHGAMTILKPGEGVTTLDLKNDFLSMAREGRLTAEAKVFKKGRQIVIVDTLVSDSRGKNISRCSATLMILREG